ncbi:sodium/glutamate symporter [Abyssisolibacter fermentans]|uniref:sodium/glutamate symporter n=1 Tax=Abyssisolibacter fermentans TaxID=1766203 RepID=UPI000A6357ED|nr:sodium/glutamate symporter [Abyssisolibacter fermentans]
MDGKIVNNILTLNFDMIATLAIAVLLLLLGYFLRKKITLLEKFCIPAPVIGGLIFAIIALILKETNVMTIKLDTTFQTPFMIAFFTIVGLGGSFSLLKKGGVTLIIYWLLCGVMSVAQNAIGVICAKLTGIHPILGVMAGAVSMEGGHGAAAAFGKTAESMGVTGASTVAIAAATFGLIAGGLIGGPIAKHLVDRNKLKAENVNMDSTETFEEVAGISNNTKITSNVLMVQIALIVVCMTVGTVVSGWFSKATGLVLPQYVGAMFVAVIVRNINDKLNFVNINYYVIDLLSNVFLGIFLSMALMSLRLWELAGLAGPLFVIVVAQVLFIIVYTTFIAFKLLGKNYDAAAMCAGMAGHGMGATPNAIANIGAVTEKYGSSPRAFLIVPVVGAFLIDLIGIPNIVWFMNMFI